MAALAAVQDSRSEAIVESDYQNMKIIIATHSSDVRERSAYLGYMGRKPGCQVAV